jgi:hypothetical protein
MAFSLMNVQLQLDGFLNPAHFFLRKGACSPEKPLLADSGQLVCHGFAFFSVKKHGCFARVQTIDIAGKRHNLNTIKGLVGGIVTYDYGRPLLSDLTAD